MVDLCQIYHRPQGIFRKIKVVSWLITFKFSLVI